MGVDYDCRLKVHNCDRDSEKYIVARSCDGEMWFWGSFKDYDMAHKVACEIDGVVFERQV